MTGFFQTTINFGSTTMALAGGGAGRTSVLVFTMPFWTLLIAWPVLHERVRGSQWFAVAFAFAGLVLVVEPWNWQRRPRARSCGPCCPASAGRRGTVATKYFQRKHALDPLNFIAWQMLVGVLPLTRAAAGARLPRRGSGASTYALLLVYVGAVSTAFGFLLWIAILRFLPAGTASLNMFAIPVIALAELDGGVRRAADAAASGWASPASAPALRSSRFNAWRASRRGDGVARRRRRRWTAA